MTQAAAAKTLGMSTVRLNEVVRGKRGVTASGVAKCQLDSATRNNSGARRHF